MFHKFGCAFLIVALLADPRPVWAHADLEEQIAVVTKQIEQSPQDARLFLKRGELRRAHQEWDLALTDYDRAAALDPNLAAVELVRGSLFLDRGKPEQATVALDRFLSRQPDHTIALFTRARVCVALGDHRAAVLDYTKAIDLQQTPRPEHYVERARALEAQGEAYIDEAVRGLDEGLKRIGPVTTLATLAIDFEVKRKNYHAALARLESITARSGRKEAWLAQRGDILELAGSPREAREAYAAAMKAIDSLAPHVRNTQAVKDLESRVRVAMERLSKEAK